MRGLIIVATIGICIAASLFAAPSLVQPLQAKQDLVGDNNASDVVLRFKQGNSLRNLAAVHLGNSDLWPEILKASKIASIADLKPGQKLIIPARIIKNAQYVLDRSRVKILDANRAGAQVFAPKLIKAAINDRNQALVKRTASAWKDSIVLATRSSTSADKAIIQSKSHRDQAAQARLSDRQGTVQGQRPSEIIWGKRILNTVLIEEEKIRTLSGSTAQVTFRDASRLRLNPNSQAVIQLMRVDPLTNQQRAKVNLIAGDFYALLGASSKRRQFQVQLPNVNASVDSGNFWVRQQPGQAKFTNYDNRPIKITALGKTLTLGENEGAVVRTGEAPKAKFKILPAPILTLPRNGKAILGNEAVLGWNSVKNAQAYWLEIAADASFNTMIETKWGERSLKFTTKKLPVGTYYWRVAALDKLGVPGERSSIAQFILHHDRTPPFLRIDSPVNGEITRSKKLVVAGVTEPRATLMVGKAKVMVSGDGSYHHVFSARTGENTVAITAIDEVGNKTAKNISFVFMPDKSANIVFAQSIPKKASRHFLTRGTEISLYGTTTRNALVRIDEANGTERATAYSDDKGAFRVNVPVRKLHEKLSVRVITASKHATQLPIEITRDTNAPKITLERPLPRLTRALSISVTGKTEPGANVLLNGKPVKLDKGVFSVPVALKDGVNRIEMTVTDRVGHVTLGKWQVRVDRKAPRFVSQSLTIAGAQSDGLIAIEVHAKDETGLAGIARYSLKAGTQIFSGYLRFNRATKSYRATLQVPTKFAASARLVTLELRDNAKNKRLVTLN